MALFTFDDITTFTFNLEIPPVNQKAHFYTRTHTILGNHTHARALDLHVLHLGSIQGERRLIVNAIPCPTPVSLSILFIWVPSPTRDRLII